MKAMSGLQQLGRALMLPIAVLPVAGLLLRLGQPDLLNLPFVAAAGAAIFDHLGMLFAIGVAVGFARENHGAAGLAGLVCFLVTTLGAQSMIHLDAGALDGVPDRLKGVTETALKAARIHDLSVPAGILSGVVSGLLYNRFSNIKLPEYLAFFGGRRFVPIAAGLVGVGLALGFGWGYPTLEAGLKGASQAIVGAGPAGLFGYGLLNRLLIVTGLHHILNNVAWFILGNYHGATGDLNRFFAGDKTAGAFMAGYFPVMMFGLPAACLAMYRAARPERRKAVGGMLLSMGLTSFLTGVTEPIEFTFMFLAPALFVVHAVLTGLSMVIMDALGVKLGFGFSAGLFDYVLNFKLATRPLWLIPVGLIYFAVYYGTFRGFIAVFKLQTPGREPVDAATETAGPAPAEGQAPLDGLIAALGGAGNLVTIDACTTRLRLVVGDSQLADEAALKRLGARGVIRPSATALQVVLGPQADQVAGELRARVAQGGGPIVPASGLAPNAPAPAATATPRTRLSAAALIAALGGAQNVRDVTPCSTRVRARVRDATRVDVPGLKALGARAVAQPRPDSVHLVVGLEAEDLAAAMDSLI
jgi:PTS system N-acetylglucosamine-specific IIC component